MSSCGCDLGVAAEELPVADHALGLGADVDQDLVLVDADDRAFDDIAVLEALDVGVLLGEQLLHRRRLGAGAPGDGRCLVLLLLRGGRSVGDVLLAGDGGFGAGLGGGGLVGDGDRRDGLLGRRGRRWRRPPPAPARSRPAARRSR